jgi:hypothetical protein
MQDGSSQEKEIFGTVFGAGLHGHNVTNASGFPVNPSF